MVKCTHKSKMMVETCPQCLLALVNENEEQAKLIVDLEENLKTWHSPENLQTACRVRDERIADLETEYLNEKRMAAKAYTACGNYQQQTGELKTEMQEVANQLMDLYDKCIETTEPEVFGTILGLHERSTISLACSSFSLTKAKRH